MSSDQKTSGPSRALPNILALLALVSGAGAAHAQYTEYSEVYAVQVSAVVNDAPPKITLTWPPDTRYPVSGYTVYRKSLSASNWTEVASLPATMLTYEDDEVSIGGAYEYQVYKSGSKNAYGYVCVGIEAPLVEDRGKVILIVDETHAEELAAELCRYQQDLVGDGWSVLRHDVSRTLPPPQVKALIKADYDADPDNVKAVFLFGHVPILKSGNFNVDGHFSRPMPADVYYGDMDGDWGDSDPNTWQLSRNDLPSDVELQVGRVDFWNMGWFTDVDPAMTEKELLRQYLNKEHNFRHKLIECERRGLIADEFGERDGAAFAASAWRGFSAFFGADHVTRAGQTYITNNLYFPMVTEGSYLWSYGCGGGSYTSCNGVGDTADFARNDIKSVFTMFLGSYFGEWDSANNFLRAPLGSKSYALASAWSGYPHWFVHHMGLGETIGYSTRLTQNNSTLYQNQVNSFTRGVHIALMGDPTLRMHVVAPVTGFDGSATDGDIALSWSPSNDTNIRGYHVYRSSDPGGPYTRLTESLLPGTSYTDAGPAAGTYTYMVRAVKLEGAGTGAFDRSGSGTYFNQSVGRFITLNTSGEPVPATVTIAATDTDAAEENVKPGAIVLTRTGSSSTALNVYYTLSGTAINGVDYDSLSGSVIIPVGQSTATIPVTPVDDLEVEMDETVTLTLRSDPAYIIGAPAAATVIIADNEVAPPTPASATFITTDTATQGNWKGAYGNDGYQIVGDASSHPAHAQLSATGRTDHIWQNSTSDVRCLEKISGTDRVAATWYSATTFTMDLDLTDGRAHRVSLYCLDWDRMGRTQTIEILDAGTNTVLNSQTVNSYGEGKYLVWDLQGHVLIRVTNTESPNAVVSGIFFDAAPDPIDGWRADQFSEAELEDLSVSGDEGDPDVDGIINLLEYALGSDPKAAESGALPVAGTVSWGGNDYLTLTFERPVAATDVTYAIEVSGDLVTWSRAAAQVSLVDNGDGTQTIRYRDTTPMTATQRFIRLKIAKSD